MNCEAITSTIKIRFDNQRVIINSKLLDGGHESYITPCYTRPDKAARTHIEQITPFPIGKGRERVKKKPRIAAGLFN